MPRKRVYRSKKKLGQAPGTVVYTGDRLKDELDLVVFEYNKDTCIEKNLKSVEESFNLKHTDTITWLNLNGLNHVKDIEKLGYHFGFHPLVLEDIVNIAQRPKVDEYDDYIFVVLKMLNYTQTQQLESEQISFIIGKNYVISFQEAENDVFDTVRNRLRHAVGRIRQMHADYLLYALIDTVIDHYFGIIETLGDKIEDLESAIFSGEIDKSAGRTIQDLKREVLRVRRTILPIREVINKVEKSHHALIQKQTTTYFKDINDHISQVSENIEIYREMIWSLMEMYMTTINNKMNEIMKVLTIMASIFIPLTFITGVYGMNFHNIPELHYKNGYYVVWVTMAIIVIAMLWYFRRKKWL
ncbi:magnesium/cobalt transporter CorA [Cognatitamlana onchidii]|uniref:magnesium/cobalt transporter CorA n=1 Tax=Cognatitamlana onchidii TaxID=2562860 RepID=UPI0010A61465|nr:magnesium/cobalt transporter CorA [Algibacter onchidii]